MKGYPLAIAISLALYALAVFVLPPLVRWALDNPIFTLTFAACAAALGMYWFRYRHELGDKEW